MNRKDYVELIWNGKEQAIKESELPTNKKLITCEEESKDFDTTQNLYIEGDNLDALKLLKEEYQNKIKMIYIDPPYNTGNKFIYNDNLSHTDWLNMIYPRLKLARNLLTDDGVIFISIDDNEQANLKKVCDEIFGEGNFVSKLVWQSTGGSNTGSSIVTVTEYIYVYAVDKKNLRIKLLEKNKSNYNLVDDYYNTRGKYYLQKLDGKFTKDHYSSSLNYPIEYKGKNIYPGGQQGQLSELWNWRWSKEKVNWGIKNGFIEFIENESNITVKFKNYEKVDNNNEPRLPSVPPKNLILSDVCTTSSGTIEINNLLGNGFFEFPKCSVLVLYLLGLVASSDSLILDFFSGSATTAHAVMKLNAEDGGNRKFIMVQLPEVCAETSEAYKAGYKNICEIGKERIRRAGQKIKEESPLTTQNLDVGFRVLKIVDKD